jgi:hypothetical protein
VEFATAARTGHFKRLRNRDDLSDFHESRIGGLLDAFADGLVPKRLDWPALRSSGVFQVVALMQDQSDQEISRVAGMGEEPRHQLLATAFRGGEPFQGFALDSGQVILKVHTFHTRPSGDFDGNAIGEMGQAAAEGRIYSNRPVT